MQDKMAGEKVPNEKDIQFMSDGYDDLVKSKANTAKELQELKKRLDFLSVGVNRIDKAINDLLLYSYQYNLKIVGIPQVDDKESSEKTTELCVNMFRAMGVSISASLQISI